MGEIIARGLEGVIAVGTRVSHVDGERGELTIAGYPVAELASHATYEETLFLLWHDRLPGAAEVDDLYHRLAARRWLPAGTLTVLAAAAARRGQRYRRDRRRRGPRRRRNHRPRGRDRGDEAHEVDGESACRDDDQAWTVGEQGQPSRRVE
jgi:hypothetical protein